MIQSRRLRLTKMHEGLVGWARQAERIKNLRKAVGDGSTQMGPREGSVSVGFEMTKAGERDFEVKDVES